MDWLTMILNRFGTEILAAISGIIGFFAKWYFDRLQKRKHLETERLDALLRLRGLLTESHSVFLSQNYQAQRLMKLLRAKHGAEVSNGIGFDETFLSLYNQFDAEEKELHSLIRSTTLNSMYRLNNDLSKWIKDCHLFLSPKRTDVTGMRFADCLNDLQLHLNQWLDKYNVWIKQDDRRSLVYLNDEKKHGKKFPEKLESILGEIIQELR